MGAGFGVGVGVSWMAAVAENTIVAVGEITPETTVAVISVVSTGIAVASIAAGEGETSGSGPAALLPITRAQPELAISAMSRSRITRDFLVNRFDIISVPRIVLTAIVSQAD